MPRPDQTNELVHEALQERDTVARYLHAIADGLSSGTLRLGCEERELELRPSALVGFELQACHDRGRSCLRLRLNWREEGAARSAAAEGLRIHSE